MKVNYIYKRKKEKRRRGDVVFNFDENTLSGAGDMREEKNAEQRRSKEDTNADLILIRQTKAPSDWKRA